MARTLTVPGTTYWRGPWTDRYGNYHPGRMVTRGTYETPDVGMPGRGPKTLPPIREPGKMTRVARGMGYTLVSDIPDESIPDFVDALVREYGEHSASGMVRWQINIRKNVSDTDRVKRKFLLMQEHLSEEYAGGGWTPPAK